MNFLLEYKTLKSGNTCDQHTRPKIPAHDVESTAAFESNEAERNQKTSTGFFPGLIKGKIKVNREFLYVQVSALL